MAHIFRTLQRVSDPAVFRVESHAESQPLLGCRMCISHAWRLRRAGTRESEVRAGFSRIFQNVDLQVLCRWM